MDKTQPKVQGIYLWLDDERPMPPFFTHHVKTAEGSITLLETGKVVEISLDHDLGQDKTGYDVALWIELTTIQRKEDELRK